MFEEYSVAGHGFRCPYLRWSDHTLTAIAQSGFLYAGSQALAWNVVDGFGTPAYHHLLDFYSPVAATTYPALPRWDYGLRFLES